MPVSLSNCWNLILESGLLTASQCRDLGVQFSAEPGEHPEDDATRLVQWLIGQNIISRYQGAILLAGRAGPFLYGDYKVYDRIADGPLTGTYRAVHAPTNHAVLLSFLTGQRAQGIRWETLAHLVPALRHPYLVRCHQAVDLGNYRFLVWEDLRGGTAAQWLRENAKMPQIKAGRLIRRVALALDYLHRQGRPHGDVRPDNLWLQQDADVRLLMDPLVDPSGFSVEDGGGGETAGPRHGFPKRTEEGLTHDMQRDLFALGCTLLELCVGTNSCQSAMAPGKRTHRFAPLAASLTAPLDQIVARLTVDRGSDRLTAREVAQRLATIAAAEKVPAGESVRSATAQAFQERLERRVPPRRTPARITEPRAREAPADLAIHLTPDRGSSSIAAERWARARARGRHGWKTMLAMLIGIVPIAIAVIVLRPQRPPRSTVESHATAELPAVERVVQGSQSAGASAVDAPDTALPALLWDTPTRGKPIRLEYLPRGAQVILVVRLAEIESSDEGQRVLRALGPDFHAAYQGWQVAAGVQPEEIESLTIGMYGNGGRFPHLAVVVRLAGPRDRQQLLAGWGNPEERLAGETTYYVQGAWAYLIPESSQAFVMGDHRRIQELAESDFPTPLLRREVGRLFRNSDDQRHFTIVLTPSFLFGDGQALLSGTRQALLRPIEGLLRDAAKAVSLSVHLGSEVCFVEARVESDVAMNQVQLASHFRDQLAELPDRMENYIARVNPAPYWRIVAFRYPQMLRFLDRQARFGVEDGQTIINAALPVSAAHNLVFGAEMLLASELDAGSLDAEPVELPPRGVEQLLQSRLTIEFDQDSLEGAMQAVQDAIRAASPSAPPPLEIRIVGEDLELEGITRNQQIRNFRQVEQPLADVLTALMLRANPLATVVSPSDPDQKLVWVVAPNPADATTHIVLVTTRQAARQKYLLPSPFREE